MATIALALRRFRAEEQERAPASADETKLALEDLTMFLESEGYEYVDTEPDGISDSGYDDDDEDEEPGFVDTNRADVLPVTVNDFLYGWLIRDSIGGADDAAASALVVQRLMTWLADERLAEGKACREAAELAGRAAAEVAGSLRLRDLLGPLTQQVPAGEPADDDDMIEDFVRITRVEPGELWLGDDIGPIKVPGEASDVAQVGWWLNVVAVRLEDEWHLAELGNVYPRLADDEAGDEALAG